MMGTGTKRYDSFRRLLRDRGGNFGIMTALAVPVLAALAGVAVDVSNMELSRSQLQEATDAAALAAATALSDGKTDNATAQSLAADFVSGQMANYLGNDPTTIAALKTGTTAKVTKTSNGTTGDVFSVVVSSSYSQPVNGMTRLLGWNQVQIGSSSTSTSNGPGVTSSQNALSMFLALDRSGSMSWITDTTVLDKYGNDTKCVNYTDASWPSGKTGSPCYVSKIAALKQAVAALFAQLNTADPKGVMTRVGAVSYTDTMQADTPLAWGTSSASTYVGALPAVPTGGTDATPALLDAYNSLRAQKETNAQTKKGNTTFSKYIILMTDGENTGNSSSWNSSLDQASRDNCKLARDAGMTVYTVAFMAPDRGKAMLQACAGQASNYYEANSMIDLIAAFKSIGQKASEQLTRLTN
jgi:Flp pilus assembly protein TadG/uncharacterized protein YegL